MMWSSKLSIKPTPSKPSSVVRRSPTSRKLILSDDDGDDEKEEEEVAKKVSKLDKGDHIKEKKKKKKEKKIKKNKKKAKETTKEDLSSSTPPTTFPCRFTIICSATFLTEADLRRHENSHIYSSPLTPYRCTWPYTSDIYARRSANNTVPVEGVCRFTAVTYLAVQEHIRLAHFEKASSALKTTPSATAPLRWLVNYIYTDEELVAMANSGEFDFEKTA